MYENRAPFSVHFVVHQIVNIPWQVQMGPSYQVAGQEWDTHYTQFPETMTSPRVPPGAPYKPPPAQQANRRRVRNLTTDATAGASCRFADHNASTNDATTHSVRSTKITMGGTELPPPSISQQVSRRSGSPFMIRPLRLLAGSA